MNTYQPTTPQAGRDLDSPLIGPQPIGLWHHHFIQEAD